MLLYLQPPKAVVGDVDDNVCHAFTCMKSRTQSAKVLRLLKALFYSRNPHKEYDRLCDTFPLLSSVHKVAAFIFVLKHTYGSQLKFLQSGAVRKDWRGYGILFDWDNLEAVAEYLQNARFNILHKSFEQTVRTAKRGDFVFLDPPYTVQRCTKKTYYNKPIVDSETMQRVLHNLHNKGCLVMLIDTVKTKYPGYRCHSFSAACRWDHTSRQEYIYVNY